MEIKLSIVIPTWNEELNIERLLIHLLANCKNSEIIIVDANSTDKTIEICKKYKVSILHSSIKSRAVQMNLGARNAMGEVFYFVHADTIPPSSFYDDIFNVIDQNILGFFRQKFESKNPLLLLNSFFTRFNFLWNRGGDQSMFLTKDLFLKLNGFNEQYSIMEEYDLMDRAKQYARRIVISKYTLVSARKYSSNSWFKVQYANYVAMRMYMEKVNPDKIKMTYQNLLLAN